MTSCTINWSQCFLYFCSIFTHHFFLCSLRVVQARIQARVQVKTVNPIAKRSLKMIPSQLNCRLASLQLSRLHFQARVQAQVRVKSVNLIARRPPKTILIQRRRPHQDHQHSRLHRQAQTPAQTPAQIRAQIQVKSPRWVTFALSCLI